MDRVDEIFLHILGAALRGVPACPDGELSEQQWQQIMDRAAQHHVLPMVYGAVFRLADAAQAPAVVRAKQPVVRQVLLQAERTREFTELYQRLLRAGVRPLVVKGIVCRSLYPEPDYRRSGDEDLLVRPEEFDTFRRVLEEYGMAISDPNADVQRDYEIPFRKSGSQLFIEAHRSLFPPESEAYGRWNECFAGVFDRAVEQQVQGGTVWTMDPEDHLFYLICHSLKHFLHGGFGIRQVCDILLFAEHYGPRVDWTRLMERCRQIRAVKFTAALLRIGTGYLGFDPARAGCTDAWLQIPVDALPLLEDLLCAGIFGSAQLSRRHSGHITLAAASEKKAGLVRTLLPPAASLEKQYPYLKGRHWLAPVAWGSRMVRYAWETKTTPDNTAAQALRLGNRRVELMKHYGMLDD